MRIALAALAILLAVSARAEAACSSWNPVWRAAAAANAKSVTTSTWTFFEGREGAKEGPGWDMYVPLILRTLDIRCEASDPGFAKALAGFQRRAKLKATGRMDAATARALRGRWQWRRDFLKKAAKACPLADVATLQPVYAGDTRLVADRRVLAAYTHMRRAFEDAHPYMIRFGALDILSAWRDPAKDREVCKDNPTCNGVAKTDHCSSHWSGMALDLYVGMTGDYGPIDSNYENRLYQSRTVIYQWMLDHAGEYGFVNYPFEPWHWEWQEEVPAY